MTAAAWAAYALLAGAALGLTFYLYLRREPTGRGRAVLALLRGAVLALVLLLLFDPELPGRAQSEAARGPLVLLDASGSMGLPVAAGSSVSRWTRAVDEARARAGNRPVLLFGEAPRPIAVDSLGSLPGDARTRVLPALQAAAESGARRVVVFTDGGVEDIASLETWLPRLGIDLSWERIGEPLRSAGLQDASAPGWVAPGQPAEVSVVIASNGSGPPRRLVVRQDTRVLADSAIEIPPAGRVLRTAVQVRPVAPPGGGMVRLDLSLEPADELPLDDRRAVMVNVAAEPAGIVLVSARPDWEPRFLLPVLERALGLPARGFLQISPGTWITMGSGAVAGRGVPAADVARAASAADLLVLHAPESNGPSWLSAAIARAPSLLVLPNAPSPVLPVRASAPQAGDWFAVDAIPASPVAPLLADVTVVDAPPLAALMTVEDAPAGAWAPIHVQQARGGRAYPALLAGTSGSRRWAVALTQGYWQWAFHGGAPRQLYERVWSAVGGWLIAGQVAGGGAAVRPVEPIQPRGAPSGWVAAGVAPDSIRLRARSAGGAVLDTMLVRAARDTIAGPALAPGSWRYQATAFAGDERMAGNGELFVEDYSPELARPIAALADVRARGNLAGDARAPNGATPLHASPAPYILMVLLLAAEWVLRRRWGLR